MDTTARVARWLTGTVRGPHTESVPHHVCTLNSTLQALRLLSSYQQHQIPPNVPQNKLQEVVQRFAEHFDRFEDAVENDLEAGRHWAVVASHGGVALCVSSSELLISLVALVALVSCGWCPALLARGSVQVDKVALFKVARSKRLLCRVRVCCGRISPIRSFAFAARRHGVFRRLQFAVAGVCT